MAVREVKQLTLTEQVAIEAVQADIVRLRNKLRMILSEAGLDPDAHYSITPEGMVITETKDEPERSPQPEHIGRNGRRAEEAGIASGKGSGEQPSGSGSKGQD